MKNHSYLREFARYTSLDVLGMLGLSFYILADTFFIAQGMGNTGLTALNLAIPLYGLIYGSSLMLGQGGATRFSLYLGQDIKGESSQAYSRALVIGAAISALFVLWGVFGSGLISRLLGADAETYEMCRCYVKVLLIFSPGFMLNNITQAFVRNDGAPQLAMTAMIIGSFSNVLLDYLLIFPLHLGMFGAILATCLAPLISLGVLLPFFIKKRNHFHICQTRLSLPIAGRLCSSGVPALVTELSSGLVMLVFNLIILRISGNVGVAAYGVVANFSLVVISIYNGIAQGSQPLLSRYCGQGRQDALDKLLGYGLGSIIGLSLLFYLGIFLGAEQIAAIFNPEQNPLLQQIARRGLRIYFSGGLFAGINIMLATYFAAIAQARPGSLISICRGFLFILPLAFLLAFLLRMDGLWAAFPVTELLVSVMALLLYRHFRRKERRG